MKNKNFYPKVTTNTLLEMKNNGEKISMLTAYDFTFAKIIDNANIDVVLVGDSASNVVAGNETTLPITLDEMIYHAKSVVKGVSRALVVVDLPFGSYQSDPKKALRSAIRIMKESGAHAVKLEGGQEVIQSIERIINKGSTNAHRCVELASGAEHTEEELKATLKSQINPECPALANPNYVPYQ